MTLDESLLGRLLAAYRACESHPSGGGAWEGETADGILEAEVSDPDLARLYRHAIIDRIRAEVVGRDSARCNVCGKRFATRKSARVHMTRMHPPEPEAVAQLRRNGRSIKGIAQDLDVSTTAVYTALTLAGAYRRSA